MKLTIKEYAEQSGKSPAYIHKEIAQRCAVSRQVVEHWHKRDRKPAISLIVSKEYDLVRIDEGEINTLWEI